MMESDGDGIDQEVIHGIESAVIDTGIAHGRATGGEMAIETTDVGIDHEVASTSDARTVQSEERSAMPTRSDHDHARGTADVGLQGASRHTREAREGGTEPEYFKFANSGRSSLSHELWQPEIAMFEKQEGLPYVWWTMTTFYAYWYICNA